MAAIIPRNSILQEHFLVSQQNKQDGWVYKCDAILLLRGLFKKKKIQKILWMGILAHSELFADEEEEGKAQASRTLHNDDAIWP